MAELKCLAARCRHRIERHEILASGRVICTDCECRDYVLPIPDIEMVRRDDADFGKDDQWPELPY